MSIWFGGGGLLVLGVINVVVWSVDARERRRHLFPAGSSEMALSSFLCFDFAVLLIYSILYTCTQRDGEISGGGGGGKSSNPVQSFRHKSLQYGPPISIRSSGLIKVKKKKKRKALQEKKNPPFESMH